MANEIKISPDAMEGRSNEYRQCGEQINQVISTMDRLLSALQGEWTGAAAEQYAAKYNSELKPNFQKAVTLTNEIADALKQAANTMREQDAAIANSMR